MSHEEERKWAALLAITLGFLLIMGVIFRESSSHQSRPYRVAETMYGK